VTLVLTTHYMDEAEQLCDRLVIMDQARIVAEGTPAQLIATHATAEVVELRVPVGVAETLGEALSGLGERLELLPDRVLAYTSEGDDVVADVARRGLVPQSVLVRRSTLEDVFLRLTGRSLVEP
jgi:lipooligosaccharide transport system ATP-binding protein